MAIVETRYGKVEGYSNNGIQGFRGIPFAAPPVGERRWLPPEPPAPWAGVRDAKDWGKQAWQAASPGEGPLKFVFNAANAEKRDEDCLQLNVWTPLPRRHQAPGADVDPRRRFLRRYGRYASL